MTPKLALREDRRVSQGRGKLLDLAAQRFPCALDLRHHARSAKDLGGGKFEVLISDGRGRPKLRFHVTQADVAASAEAYRDTSALLHALGLGVRFTDAWTAAGRTALSWGDGAGSFDYLAADLGGEGWLVDLKHTFALRLSTLARGAYGLREMWTGAQMTLKAAVDAADGDADPTEATEAAAGAKYVALLVWLARSKRTSPAARCAVLRCDAAALLEWDRDREWQPPTEVLRVQLARPKWQGAPATLVARPATSPAAGEQPSKREELRQRSALRKPPGSARAVPCVPLCWAARVLVGKSSQAPGRVRAKLKDGRSAAPFQSHAWSKFRQSGTQLWVRRSDVERAYSL